MWGGLPRKGCTSAQDSWQVLRFEGQTCSHSGSPALLMKLACLVLPRICCQKGPTLHFTYSSIARYPPAREEGASGRFFSGASSVIRNDQHPIMLSRSTFKPPIVLKGMKNTLT